jgi:HSP20 family molecular chaperone IbpA
MTDLSVQTPKMRFEIDTPSRIPQKKKIDQNKIETHASFEKQSMDSKEGKNYEKGITLSDTKNQGFTNDSKINQDDSISFFKKEETKENQNKNYLKIIEKIPENRKDLLHHLGTQLDEKTPEDPSQVTLLATQEDTQTKIRAYQPSKNSFHQMIALPTHVEETQDAYIFRISIPEDEQKNIHISISENQFVIFGKRQQTSEVQLGPEHKQSSSLYQSFSESFPLKTQVVAQALSRKYDTDTLVFHLPKKYPNA